MISYLFVGPDSVTALIKAGQIYRLPKMDADLFTASPIAQYLLRQIISKTGDEHRNDLRSSCVNNFSDARLSRQQCAWIFTKVSFSFRMKTDHVSSTI